MKANLNLTNTKQYQIEINTQNKQCLSLDSRIAAYLTALIMLESQQASRWEVPSAKNLLHDRRLELIKKLQEGDYRTFEQALQKIEIARETYFPRLRISKDELDLIKHNLNLKH